MEENNTPSLDYQKGFNEGYIIAKHMPDLAEKLTKATGESERGKGFTDGRQQFIQEQRREKYPSWLRGDRASKDTTDMDKTMDKDKDRDIEPEH